MALAGSAIKHERVAGAAERVKRHQPNRVWREINVAALGAGRLDCRGLHDFNIGRNGDFLECPIGRIKGFRIRLLGVVGEGFAGCGLYSVCYVNLGGIAG